MKINKKSVIYTFVVLIFVICLFSANYIFNVLIKTGNEPRLANISLPSETKNIKFHIDEVKRENLKWKDALSIRGWVFKENVKKEKRNVYLVLKSKNSTLIFKIETDNISRPDVSAGFHLIGGIHTHGFVIKIPLYRLKENTYHIGFVIEDETGKYYSTSYEVLSKSGETFSIEEYKPELGFVSHQVSLSFKKSVKEITYHFDIVRKSGKYVTIQGWGFLKGMDTRSLKSYILLKKNENVTIFDVNVRTRKDVSSYFIKSGLNLDSSGFQSQIPIENLEKGNYRLGIYIVKSDQNGIVYTNKYINIDK